ncbi:hypothetical protein [Kitasatospora sp. NPDC004289]
MFNLPPDTPWVAVLCLAGLALLGAIVQRILREVLPGNSRDKLSWWRDRREHKQLRREEKARAKELKNRQRQLERKQKERQKQFELKK